MLFNVQVDEGNRIVGYLIPDGFSGSSSLRITDGRNDLLILPCEQELPHIAAAGRHATGRCGFTIDETVISDLQKREALELYEQQTNILIYRRRAPSQVTQKRVFRLETNLIPLWRLDDALEGSFQYFHKGIERYGRETTIQTFLLLNAHSLYLSGRLVFKTYDTYIDETFNCVILLRDPYLDLAERLLALKHIGKIGASLLGERDMMVFAPAIAFAESIQNDDKVLHRAFATMPKAAIANLANPLTRQLAARTPDELPRRGAVAAALSTLSGFAIVGVRKHQELFLAQLAGLIGLGEAGLPRIPEISTISQLADQLRHVPEAGLLIEQDLEVYHTVNAAVEAALRE